VAYVGEAARALLAGRREREGERGREGEGEREGVRGRAGFGRGLGCGQVAGGVRVVGEGRGARGRDRSMCVTAKQDLFYACAVRASLSLRERASTSERCHMRRARLSSRD